MATTADILPDNLVTEPTITEASDSLTLPEESKRPREDEALKADELEQAPETKKAKTEEETDLLPTSVLPTTEPEADEAAEAAALAANDIPAVIEGSIEEKKQDEGGPAPIQPGKEGVNFFNDMDVLSGRGGGTNVHPGNRNFRDLINLHRRALR